MKIYINDIDIKQCSFDTTYKKCMIYSKDGIYCNHNKKLTKIDTIISQVDHVSKNNYSFIIETSNTRYSDYLNHIPYNHIYCEETFEKKHIGYDIFYIKHYYFDQVSHYFELEHIDDCMLDCIFSFLSSN
jgi:hypothetical protein